MAIDLSFTPDVQAAGAASAQFATTLVEGESYTITTSVGAWVAVGANPTAVAAGAGCMFIAANYPITFIVRKPNLKVAIIRDGASSGNASLVRGDLE